MFFFESLQECSRTLRCSVTAANRETRVLCETLPAFTVAYRVLQHMPKLYIYTAHNTVIVFTIIADVQIKLQYGNNTPFVAVGVRDIVKLLRAKHTRCDYSDGIPFHIL